MREEDKPPYPSTREEIRRSPLGTSKNWTRPTPLGGKITKYRHVPPPEDDITCDFCGAGMYCDRTSERCQGCTNMLEVLQQPEELAA